MTSVGMIGAFDITHSIVCGQSDKTELFCNAIKSNVGEMNFYFLNTYNWKKNPLKLLGGYLSILFNCHSIVLMTSDNGTRVLYPLLGLANRLFKKSIFHIVVGGVKNIELIRNHKLYRDIAARMSVVFVELPEMVSEYNELGIKNVELVPNCKAVNTSPLPVNNRNEPPYRFCVYSRINKVKGIPEAIDAVRKMNRSRGIKCSLDIYGFVEESFQNEFDSLLEENKEWVRFCGKIDRKDSRDVLCRYYALLFPTHHPEGVPGGVIDAYEAGLPIIACNSFYIRQVIKNMVTGILFDEADTDGLCKSIEYIVNNTEAVESMRNECINEAASYDSGYVLDTMIKKINFYSAKE